MNAGGITSLAFEAVQKRYLAGELLPSTLVAQLVERIEMLGRPEIWISRVSTANLYAQAARLDDALHSYGANIVDQMPLFGLPFAVKDNIDVAGMPTTAACPRFAYTPPLTALVVQKLQAAGAILMGKTNLDQFATGLVGTRSPYGVVGNAIDPEYVAGGSSSGSAVAVALHLVSFALGTDTAGSGRVPAGCNGIVGFKPTRGLISTEGVVPACRTLDCISVFGNSVQDAWRVVHAAAGFNADDAYSRPVLQLGLRRRGYRVAVPDTLEFFGDLQAQAAFSDALAQIAKLPNVQIRSVPFSVFVDAAKLLYQGPWVAERRAAMGDFFNQQPEAIDPIVRSIVAQADQFSAVDTFNAGYRLAELKRCADTLLADVDFLVVPTTPTIPRIATVAAEPFSTNSALGYYTNFVNLFDMAALALPTTPRADGLPAGITLIGAGGTDHLLAAAGEVIQAEFDRMTPARIPYCGSCSIASNPLAFTEPTVHIAVVGAHLEGQPLNWQLLERGARKLRATYTSKDYRLYALPNTVPPKPGLVRVMEGGVEIVVEVWELALRYFGSFVADIPSPLGIGSLQLADGTIVKGFICEPWALQGAQDISEYGGWQAFLSRPLLRPINEVTK